MTRVNCDICSRRIIEYMAVASTCRCGNIFCHVHKTNHICSYDFKEAERKRLAKIDVKFLSTKVEFI